MKDGKEILRQMASEPEIDAENRIVRNCVVATRSLAEDGAILLPDGIDMGDYLKNPIVRAVHGMSGMDGRPQTIGRCIELTRDGRQMVAATKFADTPLAREWAYLYGCNPKKEIFMRGWSIRAEVIEAETIDFNAAKEICGEFWDQAAADRLRQWFSAVRLIRKSWMKEYSAVELGADRNALSRAYADGNLTAGNLIFEMEREDLRKEVERLGGKIEQLDQEMKALRGNAASAASRSDTDALLAEVRAMRLLVRR